MYEDFKVDMKGSTPYRLRNLCTVINKLVGPNTFFMTKKSLYKELSFFRGESVHNSLRRAIAMIREKYGDQPLSVKVEGGAVHKGPLGIDNMCFKFMVRTVQIPASCTKIKQGFYDIMSVEVMR